MYINKHSVNYAYSNTDLLVFLGIFERILYLQLLTIKKLCGIISAEVRLSLYTML